MPLTLAFPAPAAPMSLVPELAVLARITEEVDLDDGVRVAGAFVPVSDDRLLATALADALHARYFRGDADGRVLRAESPVEGRRGSDFCKRLAGALGPDLVRRDGWRFSYRSTAGVPWFEITTGGGPGTARTASCFLHLEPGSAPEAFARLVTALDGYDLGFRARLAGDPAACRRTDTAIITVRRDDARLVVRTALRLQQRAPFALVPTVPAFTRRIAPGIGLADEPGSGIGFGRHRCRLVAAGLIAARTGTAARRVAVLARFAAEGLDPAAPHLSPGNREFRV